MATLTQRLTDIGAIADRVADQYPEDRDVTDLAYRHVTGMLKALRGVLAMHAPTWTSGDPYLCGTCKTILDDDQPNCPTVVLIDAAIRTTEPDAADRIFTGDLPMPLCQNVSMAGRRRGRYDQCDSTCTTDCGACKGHGRPDELDRLVTAVDNGRDEFQRAQHRALLGGVA